MFGLASFAEGVDLPGNYCRHVVIAKIPFAVPDDPVDASLAEWLESRGRNAFMEISVPDAALRLVQASGRLLRTESDTGRVTLLDRRLLTRSLAESARRLQIPYVDLFESFALKDCNGLYFHHGNNHWNARGQAMAADLVVEQIQSMGVPGLKTKP